MDGILSDGIKILETRKNIADADLVLVGIGSELTYPRCDEDEIILFYEKLSKILVGKNYYIITLNNDGVVRKCGFNDERIVEPCGTVNKLQCEAACSKDIYMTDDYATKEKTCPKCGKKLVPNIVQCENYVEEGYLDDWKKYTMWISSTLNRKLCVLEFGVKMEYPGIVRWPFEKIVSINNKARLVRINNSFPQLAENVVEKGISIKGDSCRVIDELATMQ